MICPVSEPLPPGPVTGRPPHRSSRLTPTTPESTPSAAELDGAIPAEPVADPLVGAIERLRELAERRIELEPRRGPALARAQRLRDHLTGHLRVRATSLDAPVLVLLVGPTGAGKSTLFNSLAGGDLSATGVVRPTTREAIVHVALEDREALLEGSLGGVPRSRFRVLRDLDPAPRPGVAVVDAPDVDSVELANRDLADRLVEAADLCLFVTTATRYADRVPWDVLERVAARGLPLIVVVNRMPPSVGDQRAIVRDVAALLQRAAIHDRTGSPVMVPATGSGSTFGAAVESPTPGGSSRVPVEVLPITEGAVVPGTEQLRASAIAPILARIEVLRDDRDARRGLASRALEGSLAGLAPLVADVADDIEHEAIDADAAARAVAGRFDAELEVLREALGGGEFLRDEALRQWHAFVGADEITRFFAHGIGKVRGAVTAVVRRPRAPVTEVREAATEDLIAIARQHAADAARRSAAALAGESSLEPAVNADPGLWDVTPTFDDRLRARIETWMSGIAEDIGRTGRPRRILARSASIGVNALGTGVMLATFAHTGGLTGTEMGLAAGTAFLNQKLLTALFGEAATSDLVGRARARLEAALATTFAEERARFEALLPPSDELHALATDLRSANADLRRLPIAIPADARPVPVGLAVRETAAGR
jgi:energy-coupling factor transporter ATP-binding protein EcfA2